jgi:hypothetical protein
MTTPAEKVALDVIFKALDSGFGDPSQKLMAVLGIAAHVGIDHGVPLEMAEEGLRNRYREYQMRFMHDLNG